MASEPRGRNRLRRHAPSQHAGLWTGVSVLVVTLLVTLVPPAAGGRHFDFTLAFMTSVRNNGQGKFVGGAFFLALDDLNNATGRLLNASDTADFRYVFNDTHNEDTTAMRAMVDQHCNNAHLNVTAFIGPDKFCNSAALLASSFALPFLSYVSTPFLSSVCSFLAFVSSVRSLFCLPCVAFFVFRA